jgi:DNA-directed RNA polymerase subunit RPC12/RpoP
MKQKNMQRVVTNQLKNEDPGKVKMLANPRIQFHFMRMYNRLCVQCRTKIMVAKGKVSYKELVECPACRDKVLATEKKVNTILGVK